MALNIAMDAINLIVRSRLCVGGREEPIVTSLALIQDRYILLKLCKRAQSAVPAAADLLCYNELRRGHANSPGPISSRDLFHLRESPSASARDPKTHTDGVD